MTAPPCPLVDDLLARARRHETPMPGGAGPMVWHDWGDGPLRVLLHGGAGSWRHWARNIGALSARHRVLAPDLPGLGESAALPGEPGHPGIAAAVAAGLRALAAPAPYDLTGFSFGANVAAHLAAIPDCRPARLTLLGASSLGLPRRPVPLVPVRALAGAARMEAHRENLARLMIRDPARIDAEALAIQAWNSDHARFRSRGLGGSDSLRRALEALSPDLSLRALYGEHDAVVVPHMADRAALFATLGAEFRVVPGAGHWVMFEASEAVDAFLGV